jgi:hypothetical protein
VPALLSCAGFGALALLLLLTVGQPLITDDTWLHLALGEAYAGAGPWLIEDPLLASSPGPPTPAAWLFDVSLFGVERTSGFTGLRIGHVALVAGILALAWLLLRRASGSLWVANLATGLFATLATYRLIQLRPHLFTMLAALLLYRLLMEPDGVPSRRRIALVALLFGAWANLHAAFLLGPLLVGAALGGLVFALWVGTPERRQRDRARAIAIAVAGGVGGLATLLNPSGLRPHLAWFIAGRQTPALGRVADEWSGVDLFSLPVPTLPPSLLAWLIFWALVIGTLAATACAVRSWRQTPSGADGDDSVDPALVALALVSLALPLIAVRFLWLGIFPLLLLAQAGRGWLASRQRGSRLAPWAGAAAALLLLPAFLQWGPWPMVSRALPAAWIGYRQPYNAGKYHANLIWMLEDAGLQGTAFTDYHMAGFAGFRLAPEIRTLINSSLNVSQEVIAANLPLRQRRGEREGERYTELLDRHGIDLFLGIRLPHVAGVARPWFHTTGHLERTSGWIPVFRNLTGAVYLRANERNRANLDRVVEYYADQGIPFDPTRGFDPEQVVRKDHSWAIRHGLIPRHFEQITSAAYGAEPKLRLWARDSLASLYAALGLYELAIELDRKRLESNPDVLTARRRLVWCLLRLRRTSEAVAAAGPLDEAPAEDYLSHLIADATRQASETADEEALAGFVARLPLFTRAEAQVLVANVVTPAPRVAPR